MYSNLEDGEDDIPEEIVEVESGTVEKDEA